MVRGLAKFKDHFKGYEAHFVLIGGAACDEWFTSNNLVFRNTKDLDIVLIVEALNPDFLRHVWDFIQQGRYQTRERSTVTREHFRFLRPQEKDYPTMLELFARAPDGMTLFDHQTIIPITVGEDVSGLSAILMDEHYYGLIQTTRRLHDGLPSITADGLIPLKARAWLDLSQRKAAGEKIDTDSIIKHRNDVFRLVLTFPDSSRFTLPDTIRSDLQQFLQALPPDSGEWDMVFASLKSWGVARMEPEAMLDAIRQHFGL